MLAGMDKDQQLQMWQQVISGLIIQAGGELRLQPAAFEAVQAGRAVAWKQDQDTGEIVFYMADPPGAGGG